MDAPVNLESWPWPKQSHKWDWACQSGRKQFYPHFSLLRIWLILWCHITWGNTSTYLVSSLPSALHHYNGILGSTLIFCARSVWKTLWPWSPKTSVLPSTNRTCNRQNLHRIWLALHYLLELWTTLSSNLFIHSIDWRIFPAEIPLNIFPSTNKTITNEWSDSS